MQKSTHSYYIRIGFPKTSYDLAGISPRRIYREPWYLQLLKGSRRKRNFGLANLALVALLVFAQYAQILRNSFFFAINTEQKTAQAAKTSPSSDPNKGSDGGLVSVPITFSTDVFRDKPTIGTTGFNPEWMTPTEITDGNDTTYWSDRNSYYAPSFIVDLGRELPLGRVRILQGTGFTSWKVRVAATSDANTMSNPGSSVYVVLTTTGTLTSGGWEEITFPVDRAYRFYRFWAVDSLPYTARWYVYTAQGFLGPAIPPPAPSDLFRTRPAIGSHLVDPPVNASAVTDQSDTSHWSDRNSYGDPWARVDLGSGAARKIHTIRILQHPELYAQGVRVQGSQNDSTYTTLTTTNGLIGGWVEIPVPSSTAYRYYKVVGLDLVGGYTASWLIYTVQGFGDVGPWDDEGNGGCSADTRVHAGKPIDTATGSFWHTFTDLDIAGRGPSLHFAHTYNTRLSNDHGPMGYGWTHCYNSYIEQDANNYYIVHLGNGAILPFNPDFSHPLRVQATLTDTGSSFVLTTTHGLTTYVFHSLDNSRVEGKLESITDRNGYTTELTYDEGGYLTTVTDHNDRTLTFGYEDDLIISVTDPAGRTVSFEYNGSIQMESFTDVGGKTTDFTYEIVTGTFNRLLTMTDPNGGVITNVYDSAHRVITQTDALGRSTAYGYYEFANGATTTQVTDTLGLVTVYYYSDNMLTQVVRNPGDQQAVTTRAYQYGTTWLSSVTDPNGKSTQYSWDNNGNLLSTTDPLTRTTQFAYNATNDLTIITDTRGLTNTLTYDQWGNITSITSPLTETNQLITTTLTYDPTNHGDVLTATNPLGNSWGIRYNQYGYVISSTNPLDPAAVFSYNNIGWLTSATNPRGYTESYTYTTYGEPYVVTNTLGYTTVYTYDDVGNLLHARDANGRVITNTFNLNNELTRFTRADGTHSDYGYDGLGRAITMTNGLAQLTQYAYDDINRVVTYTNALTQSSVTRFDLAGIPTSFTDAKNQTTTLSYDAAYQLTGINYSDAGTPDVQFVYNNLGMRTVMTDGTGTTLYSYDSLSRLTSVEDGADYVMTYTYDLASRPITITYPYNGSSVRNVIRGYDAANKLTSVTDWNSKTSTFGYNANGALTSITRTLGATTNIGYDAADQVVTMTHAITATPFLSFTYQVDPVGVLTYTAESNTAGSLGIHDYNYDTRNRLTQDSMAAGTATNNTWTYDAVTQILSTTYQSGGGTPISTTRTYNAGNQLKTLVEKQGASTLKDLTLTYDNNGNRTQRYDKVPNTTTNLVYDQANRLVSYGPYPTTYSYNGDGLRMGKDEVFSFNFRWDIGVQAGLPLMIEDAYGTYVYGPGGMLLEQVTPGGMPGSQVVYYYHTDRLGSVRAQTTSSGSPSVVNTYTYDAYGQTLTTNETVTNRFRYTGEYWDGESGLYYLRARYYDPETQQFLTVDPALAWTEEAYAYVGGSPTNFVDPTGLTSRKGMSPFGKSLVMSSAIGAVANMLIAHWTSGYNPTLQQLIAAAIGGAVAGAFGMYGSFLGGSFASMVLTHVLGRLGGPLGWAVGALLSAPIAGAVSAVGGALGQLIANFLDPCHAGDITAAALWSGLGGAIGAAVPLPKGMGTFSEARAYRLPIFDPHGSTKQEMWALIFASSFVSTLFGFSPTLSNLLESGTAQAVPWTMHWPFP